MAELGTRIAEARQRAGLTQQQCADKAGLDRSSLSKIETGTRRTNVLELVNVANALDMRLEWFLEDPPPAVVSRRNAMAPGEPSSVIDLAVERVAREVEFLRSLDGEPDLRTPTPLAMPATSGELEDCAREARKHLGYSPDEPAVDLEAQAVKIGLLVFTLPLGSEAADGASVMLSDGGVAVVNGTRHLGRRRLTVAHEIGHFLFADEFSVDWQVADEQADSSEARIDRFARALLLPEASLRASWPVPQEEDLRHSAVLTASRYQVDMATLARRLRETDLATPKLAAQVRAFRTTKADIVDFGLVVPPATQELTSPELPLPYVKAVLNAYRKDILSPARAIGLLLDTWEEAELPSPPMLPAEAIWSFVT